MVKPLPHRAHGGLLAKGPNLKDEDISGSSEASGERRRPPPERRTAEIEKFEKSREDFFTVLAHELRNPVQAIHTNATLIKSRSKDVEVCRPAEAIERQVARLSSILDDLLDVVRIAQGEELALATVGIQEVVASAVEVTRRSMDTHRRELSVQMPEAPLFVRADAKRLAQAIGNILSNAVKYSQQQGEIVVRASEVDGNAVVAVRDRGVGIEPADLPRVFMRFTDRSWARDRSAGLGLGLHIARELVERHGGRIEALSEGTGKGAEFLVHIPLTAERPASQHPAKTPYKEVESLCILVVDDNHDAADSLATLLEMHGHTGMVAYDGASALEKARKLKPHVALVDIGMPTMSGFEVAQRIASSDWGKGTTLVAVTGWEPSPTARNPRKPDSPTT